MYNKHNVHDSKDHQHSTNVLRNVTELFLTIKTQYGETKGCYTLYVEDYVHVF